MNPSYRLSRSGFTLVEVLVVIAIIGILIGLSLPALQAVREAGRRTQCQYNLSQIGLAIAEYHAGHGHFPSGTVAESGPVINKPVGYHHNWIEGLLPHLDAQVIYEAIDRDVSIYAEANEDALQASLAVVHCPSSPGPIGNETNYAGCHHDSEAPIDVTNNGVFILNQSFSIDDIPDGLSFTLFVGEKLDPIGDLGYLSGTRASLRNTGHKIGDGYGAMLDLRPKDEPERSLYVGGFAAAHFGGAYLMMGDASVKFFGDGMDLQVLSQMANRSDGAMPTDF